MAKLEVKFDASSVVQGMNKALEIGSNIAIEVMREALDSKSAITKEDMILIERVIAIKVKETKQ